MFTAILQSSSAFTGVIIAMGMEGMISLPEAVPLILGSNIGTCVVAFIASAGTNVTARRAAMAHLFFNVIGTLLFLTLLTPFTNLVLKTAATVPRQVANAHTIFNVLNAVVFLLILPYFTRFVTYLVPGEEASIEIGPNYLDKRMLPTPAAALRGAKKELLRMAMIAREMIGEALDTFIKNDLKKERTLSRWKISSTASKGSMSSSRSFPELAYRADQDCRTLYVCGKRPGEDR